MRPNLFRKLLWFAVGLGAAFGLFLALIPPRAGAAIPKSLPAPPPENRPPAHGIWAALLVASSQPEPKPLPDFLAPYEKRMKRRFGFNQFVIAEETAEPLAGDGSRWFAPSEDLAIEVRILEKKPLAEGEKAGGGWFPARINFKIYQEDRQIVDADAQMTPGKPLFIRGPGKGDGQLIFVLVAQ